MGMAGVTMHQGTAAGPSALAAIEATTRQAERARRAEAVRVRQRAALLALLVQTMTELQISMAELHAARRAAQPARPQRLKASARQ
jgi:hypothetical protein